MTDIRDFGDGRTLVVYTDENPIYRKLRNSVKCLKTVPYEQEQYSKGRVALVGVDLYFDKKYRGWLDRQIKQ